MSEYHRNKYLRQVFATTTLTLNHNLTFSVATPDVCLNTKPAGISDTAIISDSQLTASSKFGTGFQAAYGRLNGNRGDGWCAKEARRTDDWLQVDLGKTFRVCAVATQGDRNGNEWTTDFKLSYSSDGNTWITYKDSDGKEVVRSNLKEKQY